MSVSIHSHTHTDTHRHTHTQTHTHTHTHTHTLSLPHRLAFVSECAGAITCFVNAYDITGGEPHKTKNFTCEMSPPLL